MTYTPCRGWKSPPRTSYRPVKHRVLYNGKMHRDPGIGECPSCLRAVHVLDDKNNQPYIGRHAPKWQCFDVRKKRRWETYLGLGGAPPRMTGFTQSLTQTPMWQGTYNQAITMTNNAYPLMYNNSAVTYVPTTNVMNLELTSNTQNELGQYIFSINGAIYVSPNRRMTIATDYAVWNQWSNNITVSANTYTQNWTNWNTPIGNQVYPRVPQRRPAYDRVARAEDLFRRVERDLQREARAEAALRARETLLELLTEEQQAEYVERNHFHVRGSRGTLYRIKHGSSGNIRRVRSREDGDREEAAFCVHSTSHTQQSLADEVGIVSGALPHEDHMIQQMLHLMINEDEILAKANVHWGTRQPEADYEVRESGLVLATR